MPTKTLYMETTGIATDKTAAEITSLLVKSGAREIALEYGTGGKLEGLRFALVIEQVPVSFALPVRVEPVFQTINGRRAKGNQQAAAARDRVQAERVAWRQLLRWVQAQLAMIDTGMVQTHEVFLPYLIHAGTNQTLFEFFSGEGLKQLTAGGSK